MKSGAKNKSVAFIILVSIYIYIYIYNNIQYTQYLTEVSIPLTFL